MNQTYPSVKPDLVQPVRYIITHAGQSNIAWS